MVAESLKASRSVLVYEQCHCVGDYVSFDCGFGPAVDASMRDAKSRKVVAWRDIRLRFSRAAFPALELRMSRLVYEETKACHLLLIAILDLWKLKHELRSINIVRQDSI